MTTQTTTYRFPAEALQPRRRGPHGCIAAAITVLVGFGSGHVAHARSPRWVGTWEAAPAFPLTRSLSNLTFRQTVRISAGGDAIQVRLSNETGADPVVIGATRVAIAGPDGSIEPTSDRVLTFGGAATATLRAGAPVVSDPVVLPVADLTTLAVSLYLPDAVTTIVGHSNSPIRTFVAADGSGDTTDAVTFPTSTVRATRFLLSEVHVLSRRVKRVIVTMGDSITDGVQSTLDANVRWPDLLAERLKKARDLRHAVVNASVSGNTVLQSQASPNIGPSALARFDRDVLAVPGVTHVALCVGLSDVSSLAGTPAITAEEVIAGYGQLIARAHARGVKVVGCTLTPYAGFIAFTPEGEAKRQAVNLFIRTTAQFDGVIDFDAVLRDPADPSRLDPTLDSGDHFHPNDAGHRAMADGIDLRVLK